jgi:hypothetical protein
MLEGLMNAFGGKNAIAKQVAPLFGDLGKHMEDKRLKYGLDRYYYILGAHSSENSEPTLYLKYMVEKDGNRMVVTSEGKEQVFYGIDIIKNIAGGSSSANMLLMSLQGILKTSLSGMAKNLVLAKEHCENGYEYAFFIEQEIINEIAEPFMTTKADPYGAEIEVGEKLDKEGIARMILGIN